MKGLPRNTRRAQLEEWLSVGLQRRFGGRILPVDAAIADRWGILVESLHRGGSPIGTVDALIAATALHLDLVVVMRNTRDFEKTGAGLLNPWRPL